MNISGILVNKTFEKNDPRFENLVGYPLEFYKECTFKEALDNINDIKFMTVCFFEKGTLVLADFDYSGYIQHFENSKVLSFVLGDTSMCFCLHYSENKQLIRSIMEVNNEVIEESGQPLPDEIEISDLSITIRKLFHDILEIEIDDIPQDVKCYKCKIINRGFDYGLEYEEKIDVKRPIEPHILNRYFSEDETFDLFQRTIAYLQRNEVNFFLNSDAPMHGEHVGVVKNLRVLRNKITESSQLSIRATSLFGGDFFKYLVSKNYRICSQEQLQNFLLLSKHIKTPYYDALSNLTVQKKPWWKFW
jgi:hypothetical protein